MDLLWIAERCRAVGEGRFEFAVQYRVEVVGSEVNGFEDRVEHRADSSASGHFTEEEWHASEHFEEDGVIMFSAEQLMPGFMQPKRFLNIGLYEYTRVFRNCYPTVTFPSFGEEYWPALEEISGFQKDKTIKYIGLKEIDMTALAVSHFFVFGEKFKEVLPTEYAALAAALKVAA